MARQLQNPLAGISKNILLRPDFVFDIETIPDAALCRAVYGTPGMSDDEAIRTALTELNREEKGILPEAFQKPIVIAACVLDYEAQSIKIHLWIEGRKKTPDEQSILAHFWQALGASSDRPRRIVSFNGKAFDMRVLEVRSLQFEALSAKSYFKPGEKYDTYRHKFSEEEHLDLIEYIPNYGSKAGFSLRTIASLVGLPGKDQMDGSQVYPVYQEGGIMKIAAYCLEDVVQTALIKIRLDRLRGILTIEETHARIEWFLRETEAFLVTHVVELAPEFNHTLDEIRNRYRPALLRPKTEDTSPKTESSQ